VTATVPQQQKSIRDAIAVLWSDVLGLESVGGTDNFFELGGHSLLAAEMITRLSATLNMRLPVSAVFATPTINGLATAIENGEVEAQIPIPRVPRKPLTE